MLHRLSKAAGLSRIGLNLQGESTLRAGSKSRIDKIVVDTAYGEERCCEEQCESKNGKYRIVRIPLALPSGITVLSHDISLPLDIRDKYIKPSGIYVKKKSKVLYE